MRPPRTMQEVEQDGDADAAAAFTRFTVPAAVGV